VRPGPWPYACALLALTVAGRVVMQLKIFAAWSNSDSAAVSFLVKVFKGTATAPPTVDVTAATALVRSPHHAGRTEQALCPTLRAEAPAITVHCPLRGWW
jgi:hypothetical protein